MAKVDDAIATFERNIEIQTGRTVEAWAVLASQEPLRRHGEAVAWLKSTHGLSHAHANHVAKRLLKDAAPLDADPIDALFAGAKAGLRPLYDRLAT